MCIFRIKRRYTLGVIPAEAGIQDNAATNSAFYQASSFSEFEKEHIYLKIDSILKSTVAWIPASEGMRLPPSGSSF